MEYTAAQKNTFVRVCQQEMDLIDVPYELDEKINSLVTFLQPVLDGVQIENFYSRILVKHLRESVSCCVSLFKLPYFLIYVVFVYFYANLF